MYKLLDGIKIVDLTHVLAGPYCAYQLGLLGADITRIENPASVDLPRILDADRGRRDKGMGLHLLLPIPTNVLLRLI
jgi:CoA:oxalate CoA-transferase